jgi:hypothetical protein
MSDTFKSFSTNSGSSQNDSFLESNSLVSKFAFLLLAILGFVILLIIGIGLVASKPILKMVNPKVKV